MSKRLVLTVCAVLGCAAVAEAGVWEKVKIVCGFDTQPKAPTIKVLVGKDLEGAMVEVKGKYNLYDPYKNEKISSRFFGKSRYIQPVTEGLKWGETFPGTFQIAIIPDQAKTTTVVNGIEYKGELYVYQTGHTIQIVNVVPVEDYVHSILSVHSDSSSREVMSAMAIALRSDACYTVVNDSHSVWNVDAEKVGYTGYSVTKRDNLLKDVMASTRHLVLSKTRSFEGTINPIETACLDAEFGRRKSDGGWSTDEAKILANKGENAAKILRNFYPEASVEMLSTMEQDEPVKDVASSKKKLARDSATAIEDGASINNRS